MKTRPEVIKRDVSRVQKFSRNPVAGLLFDTLEEFDIKLKQAADAMKIPAPRLSQIKSGEKKISADMALRFEKYLGVSAKVLM